MRAPSNSPDQVLSAAREALEKGDLAATTAILGRAIEQFPDHPPVQNLMAIAHHFQGNQEAALPHARRASELAPDVAQFVMWEATILIALERNDAAITCLERALELAPGDVDALNNLGATFLKIGRPDEAEHHFRQAVECEPAALPIRNNLGLSLYRQNKLSEAADQYREVLDRAPDDDAALFELGRILYELDSPRQAEIPLRKLLRQKPDSVDALIVLAQICRRRGAYEEGERFILRAQSCAPENQKVFENKGNFCLDWHKSGEALQAFIAAFNIDPVSPGTLAGLSHFTPDQWGFDLCQAITSARAALGPDEINSRLILDFAKARALDKAGNHDKAWRVAVQANADFRRAYPIDVEPGTDFAKHPAPGPDDPAHEPETNPPDVSGLPPLIIIAGMQRAGKSTTEALMANIPGVKRGYETNIFSETIEELNQRGGLKLSRLLGELPDGYLREFQEIFYGKFAERAGDCSAYTITIPAMYVMNSIPQILRILPNAVMLLLNRDAWDNAFKIFFSLYVVPLDGYSYRFASTIKQIELWRSAALWWSKKEPRRCLAVGYENVVADPVSSLAEICGFCDLPLPAPPLAPVFDDRGCAAPYRQMMETHLRAEGESG